MRDIKSPFSEQPLHGSFSLLSTALSSFIFILSNSFSNSSQSNGASKFNNLNVSVKYSESNDYHIPAHKLLGDS